MPYHIIEMDPNTDRRWNNFVFSNTKGSIYHHSLWIDVIYKTYKYEPVCIGIENIKTKKIEGIFPTFLVKSKFTGNRIVSVPFTTYCDILVDKYIFSEVINYIFEKYPKYKFLEVKYLNQYGIKYIQCNFQKLYYTHILSLDYDIKKTFESVHRSARKGIRKAEKNNLKLRFGESENDLKEFYKLEVKVRQKHGLPPQPYSFFLNMFMYLYEKGFMYLPIIEKDNKVLAAGIILKYKNIHYIEYTASDNNYLSLRPNNKLFWEIIKYAHNDGAKFIDFGRTENKNKSLIKYKENWGAKPFELSSIYYPEKYGFKIKDRKILKKINTMIPKVMLKLEGKIVYSHFA